MSRYAKLIMTTASNNNKYYLMEWDGKSSTFDVTYGRIEASANKASYPISLWNKKFNEKVKKGYVDVTEIASVAEKISEDTETVQTLKEITDSFVASFINLMEKYTKNLVSTTYSVKPKQVTEAQVKKAQEILDDLHKADSTNINLVNQLLLTLYTIIPRRMQNVPRYLLPNIDLGKTLQQEQDNLDAMASQIEAERPVEKKEERIQVEEDLTYLDKIGIKMSVASDTSEIDYILKQITRPIVKVFKVEKPVEDTKFTNWINKQKDKSTRFLIHGTRCTSVLPILEQGLKIRPVGNFSFSGKVYGDGNYFSEVASKSMNYTGSTPDRIFLIYEVHVGNPFIYEGWFVKDKISFPLNYKELSSRGFDSTYVKAGNGLLNSEIIAYREEQCTPKYIIHLK